MTKRKYVVLIVILVLALALTAFCLWYTRPMTFDHLSPEVDLPACQEIRVDATYHNASHDRDEYELTISPDDPAFDQLLSLLEHQTYRCSLRNLLPQTSRTVSLQPGDFQWHIILEYEEAVLFPDGTWGKGALLQFHSFYDGTLDVSFAGNHWQAVVPKQEQWLSDLMQLILDA